MTRHLFSLSILMAGASLLSTPSLAVDRSASAPTSLPSLSLAGPLRDSLTRTLHEEYSQEDSVSPAFINKPGDVLLDSPPPPEVVRFWKDLKAPEDPKNLQDFLSITKEMGRQSNFGYAIRMHKLPEQRSTGGSRYCNYRPAIVQVGPSRGSLEFYQKTVAPALHRFYAPLALSKETSVFTYRIDTTSDGQARLLPQGKSPENLMSNSGQYTVLVPEPLNVEALLNPTNGATVKVRHTAYHLPKEFKPAGRALELNCLSFIMNDGKLDVDYSERLKWSSRVQSGGSRCSAYSFTATSNNYLAWNVKVTIGDIRQPKSPRLILSLRDELAARQIDFPAAADTPKEPTPDAGEPTPAPATPAPDVGEQTPAPATPAPDAVEPTPAPSTPAPDAGAQTPAPSTPAPDAGEPTPAPSTPAPDAGAQTPTPSTPAPDTASGASPAGQSPETHDLFPGEEFGDDVFGEEVAPSGPVLGEAGSIIIDRRVTEEEKAFWESLAPLEDKQDIKGLQQTMSQIVRNLTPGFQVILKEVPAPIPFEQLTEKQAKQGKNWFGPSTIEVRESAEWFEYYGKTIAPALHRFFAPLAISRAAREAQYKINKRSDGGFSLKLVRNPIPYLVKENTVSYIVTEIAEPEKLLHPTDGDLVTFRYYAYQLPQAFGTPEKLEVSQEVYRIAKDGDETIVSSVGWSNLVFEAGGNWWCVNPYSHPSLGAQYQLPPFCVKSPEELVVTFSQTAPPAPEIVRTKGSSTDGNFFFLILLFILISSLLSLPYMLWILFREKLRAHVPLPIPDGMTGDDVNPEDIAEECHLIREFYSHLSVITDGGDQYRVITRKRELDTGFAILKKLRGLKDMSPSTRYYINQFGEELNTAQTRVFNGNMKVPTLGSSLTFIIFAIMAYFSPLASILPLLAIWTVMTLIYFLSMKCPNYKLLNPEPGYYRFFVAVLLAIGVSSIKTAVDMAESKYATIYRDSRGNTYISRDDQSTGCALAALLLGIIIFMAPFFFMSYALCHFYRNYIASK